MPRQWLCVKVAVAVCMLALWAVPAQPAAGPADASVAREVVDRTNAERSRRGRPQLRVNARLMRAAQLHAEQMARAGRLAHVLPDVSYPRIEDRLAAVKYGWQAFGENVAWGQSRPAEAVESWMGSRGHRTNILSPDFTEMGTGVAIDAAGRRYYVQVFARPLS